VECLDITIFTSDACFLDDGKLPASSQRPASVTAKIPLKIDINGKTLQYNPFADPPNSTSLIYTEQIWPYYGPPGSTVLMVYGNGEIRLIEGYDLTGYGLNDPFRIEYRGRLSLRYRLFYQDYVIEGIKSLTQVYQPNGSFEGIVLAECDTGTISGGPGGPGTYNIKMCGDSPYTVGTFCCNWECVSSGIFAVSENCTICGGAGVTFSNSCREPEYPENCHNCITSPSVDYTTLPSYPNYFDGCTGRPIDIDVDSCTREIRPETFPEGKTSFTLYYQATGYDLFLVIDDIAYDAREANLVKVFTTETPQEMREQVCTRLRFATVVNPNLISTDINSALVSNWPYNDLYWLSDCSGLSISSEVPINLIPC
jgi:hypothetical protein